jgi:hypothetical protein
VNRFMTGRTTRLPAVALLAGALVGAAACGDAVRQSRASSYLVIENLTGASGATPTEFSNTLDSDVVTNVETSVGGQSVTVPTVYEDLGQVNLKIAMKNPGTTDSPLSPSSTNQITVTRYHITYTRADGRNTPGVDVPYPFDGAATGTVSAAGTSLTFVLVRAQAKLEAPLKALAGGGGSVVLSTIAEVTLYGHDQAGNDVTVTGNISVNFADWGDPS